MSKNEWIRVITKSCRTDPASGCTIHAAIVQTDEFLYMDFIRSVDLYRLKDPDERRELCQVWEGESYPEYATQTQERRESLKKKLCSLLGWNVPENAVSDVRVTDAGGCYLLTIVWMEPFK